MTEASGAGAYGKRRAHPFDMRVFFVSQTVEILTVPTMTTTTESALGSRFRLFSAVTRPARLVLLQARADARG